MSFGHIPLLVLHVWLYLTRGVFSMFVLSPVLEFNRKLWHACAYYSISYDVSRRIPSKSGM